MDRISALVAAVTTISTAPGRGHREIATEGLRALQRIIGGKGSTAAHRAVEALAAAGREAAAAKLLCCLPWGAVGTFFIRRRHGVAQMEGSVVMYRQGRPVAGVDFDEYGQPDGGLFDTSHLAHWVRVPGRGGAEQRRLAAAVREALRGLPEAAKGVIPGGFWWSHNDESCAAGWRHDGAGWSHPALPMGWTYCPGQEGGYFCIPTFGPVGSAGGDHPPTIYIGAGRAVKEVCGAAQHRVDLRRETAAEIAAAQAAVNSVRYGARCGY
jgi:hypothetical protein